MSLGKDGSQAKNLRSVYTIACIILAGIMLSACSEGEGHTTLRVNFDTHPAGGDFIQELQTSFTITRNFEDRSTIFEAEPQPDEVDIRFEWWVAVPGSSGSPSSNFSPRDVVIDTDRDGWRWTIGTGNPDLHFVNEWWVRATWRDDDGRHEVDSRRALCLPRPSDVQAPIVSLDGKVKEDVDAAASNLERLR